MLAIATLGCQSVLPSGTNKPNNNNTKSGEVTVAPLTINFGIVKAGDSESQPAFMTNIGGTTLTVTQVTPSKAGYSVSGITLPLTLTAGQGKGFNVIFSPLAAGKSNGSLAIANSSSSRLFNVPLSGNGVTAGALSANPASLNFGSVTVGSKQFVPETLTNSGGTTIHISQAMVAGAGFSISGLNPPLLLAPGQQYTFKIIFTPPFSGNATGSVSILSDASNSNLSIPLSGIGTAPILGQLTVTPTNMNLGNVVVGANSEQNATLSASGATVVVTSGTVNGLSFALGGLSYPVTIPTGQQVQFSVTFTPQVDGIATGNISFASNASTSPTVEPLTGTGIHAVQPNPIVASFLPSNQTQLDAFTNYVLPHISAVMVRIKWSQIESDSTQGIYNFTTLDAMISDWTGQDKNVAIIVQLNNDDVLGGAPDTAVPEYVYTAAWAQQCCNAPPLDVVQCHPSWSPFPMVYEEPFRAAAEPFLAAVLNHLDGNPNILYVRAGYAEGGENTPFCYWKWPGFSEQVFLDYFTEMTDFVAALHSTTRFVNNANGFMGLPMADTEAGILHARGVGIGMQALAVSDKTNYESGKPCHADWCAWATEYSSDYRYLQPSIAEQLGDPVIYVPFAESFGINALEIFARDLLIAYNPEDPNYQQYHAAYQQAFGLP